ncbi:TPA: hypothetical protein MIS55_26170, partial [Klebsiella pneumoniae]|nr:hypothetical protein [Klebsiella pneumoniae]
FAGKKSAQIREILISESAWEEMTCLFAPSLERNDCQIVYRYRSWQMIENGETKAKAKSHRLYNLLSSIT